MMSALDEEVPAQGSDRDCGALHQQLEVFGPGRATPEQEQAKDLSKTDSGETKGHGAIVAVRRGGRRGGRSPW